MPGERIRGSFRDPDGSMFTREGVLYRQINRCFQGPFDALVTSGLFERLWSKNLLIRHEAVDIERAADRESAVHVIRPERIPFISYPYEWSFSMYRDAALATLDIQREALALGYTLKDASAYNIQFVDGRPVFIDTLSFEPYAPGRPWVAYRQFCQHFLAPLALMARVDIRLGTLMRDCIDGIPLDLASRLLGARARFNPGLFMHVHLHGRSQIRHADASAERKAAASRVSPLQLQAILDSLRNTIGKLRWKPTGTEWGDYYTFTNYSDAAFAAKRSVVEAMIRTVAPASAWDLGANNGAFTRLAARQGIPSVAFDIDPAAVEKNYLMIRNDREQHLLPLIMDLTNPSPALGWANAERDSLVQRGPVDLVLALALIHHLAISNNVPLGHIAEFLAALGRHLVIEFVPKEDSQVQKLLATRADVFPAYNEQGFEAAFSRRFEIVEKQTVDGTCRTLYRMRRRG
ncbi:MAG: SAM-dependent methyltransferase [Lentisphaerae bacterium]|nr:SAM-dependent methyltransferase [Lentisphaerota bacterium]